jgi:hypothetical protein
LEVEVLLWVVVAVVPDVVVADVSVVEPDGIAEVDVLPEVAEASVVVIVVSVELIVPVVPVADVSVDIVVEDVALESVTAVSVLTFSSFLQPTAKMAIANSATRVR